MDKKIVLKVAHYNWIMKYFGVEPLDSKATNVDRDQAMMKVISERNPEAPRKELDAIRDKLAAEADEAIKNRRVPAKTDSKKTKARKGTEEVEIACPTAGQQDPTSPDCQKCGNEFPKDFEACAALTAEAKVKREAKKKASKPASTMRRKYSTWEELQKNIKSAELTRVTIFVDSMLLKGYTYATIVKKVDERREKEGWNDFKTISRVKSHVNHREKNDNWIFERTEDKAKLIGYNPPA